MKYPDSGFVIYTRGRTGSTVLTDLINCNPDIFCDVEIFNLLYSNSKVRFPYYFINSCSKRAFKYEKSVYGFKVKISQLRYEHRLTDYSALFNKLFKKGWKFIYLKRRNFLEHKLSNLLTQYSNIFHLKKKENYNQNKIKIDCNLLLNSLIYSEEVERLEEDDMRNIHHLRLVYEDDLLNEIDHQRTADRVFSYLNLNTCYVKSDYKKIASKKLEENILNYDEIYEFFKETKFRKYLDLINNKEKRYEGI